MRLLPRPIQLLQKADGANLIFSFQPESVGHVPELSRQSSTASAASWIGPDEEDGTDSGGIAEPPETLKLPDVICLLRQRKDDEIAEDLLEKQEDLTKDIMVQAKFGLPKDDKTVAAFPCRQEK